MPSGKAIVRQEVEKIPGVVRTWIEWEGRADSLTRSLIVEVDAGTDPEDIDFDQNLIDRVVKVASDALVNKTTMVLTKIRIVPSP